MLTTALGPDIARTVQGGAEVAADFAAQPWDHLVFTGSTAVGRKVMEAAAKLAEQGIAPTAAGPIP